MSFSSATFVSWTIIPVYPNGQEYRTWEVVSPALTCGKQATSGTYLGLFDGSMELQLGNASEVIWSAFAKPLCFDRDRGTIPLLSPKRPRQGCLCKEPDIPSVDAPLAFPSRFH